MPRTFKATATLLGPALFLAACAQTPMGPTIAVMPAPGKPFDVFQADQVLCQHYAQGQVSGQAEDANMRGVGAAALTTALGAGLGAAIGGGRGAGIGAASGALGGAGIGATTSGRANMTIQQRYDISYAQCMYSRGNQVPGFAPSYPGQSGFAPTYPGQPGYPPPPGRGY